MREQGYEKLTRLSIQAIEPLALISGLALFIFWWRLMDLPLALMEGLVYSSKVRHTICYATTAGSTLF